MAQHAGQIKLDVDKKSPSAANNLALAWFRLLLSSHCRWDQKVLLEPGVTQAKLIMFLAIIMNTGEKIPFKDCVTIPKAMGSLVGVTWQFKDLRMTSWCDGAFTRNPVFGMGELFLSPASLRGPCCPREMGSAGSREMPDVPLDAKSSCPLCCTAACVSPSLGQNKPGFWLSWRD